jgi:hypothetical protein
LAGDRAWSSLGVVASDRKGSSMAVVMIVVGLVAVAGLGWLAGMLTFRRSHRWCPRCGQTLRCTACRHTAVPA